MTEAMQQRSFSGNIPRIANANERHVACLFLLDTSGSMAEETMGLRLIDELVSALNRFKTELCEDPTIRDILDVAIVEFNTEAHVVQDFVPIEYMEPVSLRAHGGTNMTAGLRISIDMILERTRFYLRRGIMSYCPWILMITGGYPSSPIDDIAEEILKLDQNDTLRLWSLAVQGANISVLQKLGHGKRALTLRGHDFTQFFDWLHSLMRPICASSPGERPKGQNLPDNVALVKAVIDDLM